MTERNGKKKERIEVRVKKTTGEFSIGRRSLRFVRARTRISSAETHTVHVMHVDMHTGKHMNILQQREEGRVLIQTQSQLWDLQTNSALGRHGDATNRTKHPEGRPTSVHDRRVSRVSRHNNAAFAIVMLCGALLGKLSLTRAVRQRTRPLTESQGTKRHKQRSRVFLETTKQTRR